VGLVPSVAGATLMKISDGTAHGVVTITESLVDEHQPTCCSARR
jgi:hypothetical protein